jgi:hypothetical protein
MFAEETTSVASDRRVFTAGEHTGGLENVVAGEQERTEHLARLGGVDVRRRRHHVVEDRAVDVEVLVLLGVVADLQAVAGLDDAGVGLVHAGEDPEQCGLAGAVEAEHDHFRSAIDGEVDVGEDLQRSVRLGEVLRHERRLAARRGLREAQLRDAVLLADLLEAEHLLGARDHLVRRGGLGRLGTEARGLQLQRRRLLLDVDALLLAAFLVGDRWRR